ncbi:IclR family transcriptional regulator [Achromobacter veterisilvae]|jgi:DNA-binding IclR family transcriptional regulator|uniref:IclR family transcriptional regulator n=1 Tax=Achromobacter veterisilvae TaxID=2069367 RepID=A0A446CI56_9BURK|nr:MULTISPECIES: IclR family transcriptional regulator [Achromobacter]MCW0210489.1 IclR family transcriptional regulator [Achromobacter sp.]SSW67584.1 Transcriptional repressor IclR [Achromobacter veterisilvae]
MKLQRKSVSEAMAPAPVQESNALLRGLKVLAALADAARPMSLSDIGEGVGLPPSTTHRVLQNLLKDAYVYQDAQGRYGLGAAGLQPLPLDHPLNVLRRDAIAPMRALQAAFGPSILLFAFPGRQRVVVDYVPGSYHVTPYFDTRVTAPLHASVSGKLLLSGLGAAERDELLGPQPYRSRTDSTLVKRSALFKQLDAIASDGIATNVNENVQGISAIGTRLATPEGRNFGAIVITGPASFFTDAALTQMGADLSATAEMLRNTSASSRLMGRLLGR